MAADAVSRVKSTKRALQLRGQRCGVFVGCQEMGDSGSLGRLCVLEGRYLRETGVFWGKSFMGTPPRDADLSPTPPFSPRFARFWAES